MQGQVDIELNERGIEQAEAIRKRIGDVCFDAVYASPLNRAITTAQIVASVDRNAVITDERIIEADFGRFEGCKYHKMGIKMTLYWAFPEIFKAPDTVETVESMINRSRSFLREIENKDYENVLIVCHGGIIRPICGYLEERKNGIRWRPKPRNCETRVYESIDGKHRLIADYILEE